MRRRLEEGENEIKKRKRLNEKGDQKKEIEKKRQKEIEGGAGGGSTN